LSNNQLTGLIPLQLQNSAILFFCNVWFGNELTCVPTYPSGVTRCMGIQSYNDYNGDSPTCPTTPSASSTSGTSSTSSTIPSTSSTIPSTSSTIPGSSSKLSTPKSTSCSNPSVNVVSHTVTWSVFPSPYIVRLQYQSDCSKGGWIVIRVGLTQTSYTFNALQPNTKYEYRVVAKTGTVTTQTPKYTFTTPSS